MAIPLTRGKSSVKENGMITDTPHRCDYFYFYQGFGFFAQRRGPGGWD
jgi:hypothetical protein